MSRGERDELEGSFACGWDGGAAAHAAEGNRAWSVFCDERERGRVSREKKEKNGEGKRMGLGP